MGSIGVHSLERDDSAATIKLQSAGKAECLRIRAVCTRDEAVRSPGAETLHVHVAGRAGIGTVGRAKVRPSVHAVAGQACYVACVAAVVARLGQVGRAAVYCEARRCGETRGRQTLVAVARFVDADVRAV